jgi:WW domain-binding protein 4
MSATQKKLEPWRNDSRYHCKACNIWCDNNRQSILIHENGKKHQEAVERSLEKRRSDKLKEEKDLKYIQSSLKQMEQAAFQSQGHNDSMLPASVISGVPSLRYTTTQSAPRAQTTAPPPDTTSSKNEKKEWMDRKKQRIEEKKEGSEAEAEQPKPKRRRISGTEGTYEINGDIYLEGPIYSEILEEDMPVQIWIGPLASVEEKRLIDRERYWKKGLITYVRRIESTCKVHVAYLASPDDEHETIGKNVAVARIRILLGSDENIPDTLEEARLLAMGGDEIEMQQPTATKLNDATGFSTWSTVTIKRTTVRQETKEERARLREQRKQAFIEKEAQAKEAEARRMEEAKVANADDSALGAFDVWGKGGYKGIDIQKEADVTVADTAKSLAKGSVAFKKKKKTKGKRNIRQTSADD